MELASEIEVQGLLRVRQFSLLVVPRALSPAVLAEIAVVELRRQLHPAVADDLGWQGAWRAFDCQLYAGFAQRALEEWVGGHRLM